MLSLLAPAVRRLAATSPFGLVLGLMVTVATFGTSAAQSPATEPHVDSTGAVVKLAADPAVVGPGVISTPAEEFKATVSPDGHTLLYVVTDHRFRHMTIVESHWRINTWAQPVVAAFSGIWRDGDPSFAPDGRSLVFISNRPFPGDAGRAPRRTFNAWHVERHSDGTWSQPSPLGPTINTDTALYGPSLTASGVLYFSRGDFIYRAVRVGTNYGAPEPLPFKGGDPSIAADERFIIFDDVRDATTKSDLFISCRTATGWSAPARLADPVNSNANDGDPWISVDGRWLYFFSDRYTPAPDRAPRAARARYSDIEREALSNIYNGSRNLYRVELTSLHCAG